MDSDRYIKNVERFYNHYSDHYNESNNKLSCFSELSNIYTGVKTTWDKRQESLTSWKKSALRKFKIEYVVRNNKEGDQIAYGEALDKTKELEFKKLESVFADSVTDFYGYTDIVELWDDVKSELNKILEPKDDESFLEHFQKTFYELQHLRLITPNLVALDAIMKLILAKGYPDRLSSYNEMPEEEKEDITKVGRPFNKDLPQSEVEIFVKNKLFPNGEKTNNKKFIHQTGEREGTPIWNQLALKYFEENPELEINDIITKRWLVERIKKAYEVIITSLN